MSNSRQMKFVIKWGELNSTKLRCVKQVLNRQMIKTVSLCSIFWKQTCPDLKVVLLECRYAVFLDEPWLFANCFVQYGKYGILCSLVSQKRAENWSVLRRSCSYNTWTTKEIIECVIKQLVYLPL